jgi:multiple sugar transport system substrate-binding protein
MYTAASNERLIGEPFSRIDMADQLINDPVAGAYIEQAPRSVSWPLVAKTYDNGLNDQIIKYYENAINSSNTGNVSPETMSTVANGVQQVLNQYNISTGQGIQQPTQQQVP